MIPFPSHTVRKTNSRKKLLESTTGKAKIKFFNRILENTGHFN